MERFAVELAQIGNASLRGPIEVGVKTSDAPLEVGVVRQPCLVVVALPSELQTCSEHEQSQDRSDRRLPPPETRLVGHADNLIELPGQMASGIGRRLAKPLGQRAWELVAPDRREHGDRPQDLPDRVWKTRSSTSWGSALKRSAGSFADAFLSFGDPCLPCRRSAGPSANRNIGPSHRRFIAGTGPTANPDGARRLTRHILSSTRSKWTRLRTVRKRVRTH